MPGQKFVRVISAFAVAVLAACESVNAPEAKDAGEPLESLPRALTSAEKGVIASSNKFAFDLLREVDRADTSSNVFISPLSASMALGMTMNGARGPTLDAMRGTLGFGQMPLADINASYRSLIDLLLKLDPSVDMRIANSIWATTGFPFEAAFFQTTKTFFDAEATTLDFRDPKTVGTINAWVDRSTNGKIKTILDEIPPEMVMYLINAIYFKGTWRQQFDPAQTRDAAFTRADGSRQTVKMMHRTGGMRFLVDEGVQAVDLPYGQEAFSMTVILPAPGSSVDQLVSTLNADRWQRWTERFSVQEVELALPRFRLEYQTRMNDPLVTLGMGIAFGLGATDFTGLSPRGRELAISEVKQKTYVDVNEEGTEAAAVTSVGIGRTSLPSRVPFIVDRPFVVAIREKFSGTILFLGKVTAPPVR